MTQMDHAKDALEPNNPHQMTNRRNEEDKPANEPLSGSKKVKNQNHSRNNKGEGR